ncbi:hypothetical protein [Nocardioides sp.]|uniref:hypothetical protein n=1 Tax=Nocardioides sp. TaxID=35761 RepID=UPI0019A85EB1|nr:hypothetical protein [Nocardioides sp.]MBC7277527.1 hypothetical protein [Nocardioides sp.]
MTSTHPTPRIAPEGDEGLREADVAYFNPLPLVLAVVTRPRAWLAYLAAQRQLARS